MAAVNFDLQKLRVSYGLRVAGDSVQFVLWAEVLLRRSAGGFGVLVSFFFALAELRSERLTSTKGVIETDAAHMENTEAAIDALANARSWQQLESSTRK